MPSQVHEPYSHDTRGNELITELKAAGMTRTDIDPWMERKLHGPSVEQVAADILEWMKHFPKGKTAAEWYDTALPVEDAVLWANADYSPTEAEFAQLEPTMRAMTTPLPARGISAAEEWRTSGLPATWVVECMRADVWSIEAARRLYRVATSLLP